MKPAGKKTKGRNKYGAEPQVVDGIRFASKREAKRYGELKLLQQAGQISGLIMQPKIPIEINDKPVKIRSAGYPNGRTVYYYADFAYEQNGWYVYEDAKGKDTPVSRLKRALVEAIHGVEVRVV